MQNLIGDIIIDSFSKEKPDKFYEVCGRREAIRGWFTWTLMHVADNILI